MPIISTFSKFSYKRLVLAGIALLAVSVVTTGIFAVATANAVKVTLDQPYKGQLEIETNDLSNDELLAAQQGQSTSVITQIREAMKLKSESPSPVASKTENNNSASNSQDTATGKIKTALKTMNAHKPFAYYDLQLSGNEIEELATLKIESADGNNNLAPYDNYGDLDVLSAEVESFVRSLGNDNERTPRAIAQIVNRIARNIIQGSEQETAWVSIRPSNPHPGFDLARWHTDGHYYAPFEGDQYKFAITLKGPSTLFCHLPSEKRTEFNELQDQGTWENNLNRETLAALIARSRGLVSTPQPTEGAIFIAGSNQAAVHSEPPINQDRLFMSVLPASKEQIKELKARWASH